ncbi:hypothetical protein [Streptomyces sp. NPDC029004]|uniref:hypothetical protein n=1 Tax=Streptomyces sp. NPDC029004 TaxID=3154490 RepID=UPI0033C5225B
MNGASLPWRPGSDEPDVSAVLGNEDATLASWALLDADPLAELRILAEEEGRHPGKYVPPLGESPAEELSRLLLALPQDSGVREAVAARGLDEADVDTAAREVADALRPLLGNAMLSLSILRQAVARAVVAGTLTAADTRWDSAGASVDGATVDDLVGVVLAALGEPGAALSVVSDAARPLWLPFWRSAEWLASWRLRRRRSQISDRTAPPIGDILRYQARGDGLRTCIADTLRSAEPPVMVLAHSLGGVACVDLFATEDHRDKVKALVTVGSQAPFLYEMDALTSLPFGRELPAFFPERWLNVYDPRDPLAYVGERVFGADRITDVPFNTRRPLLRAHSAYWDHAPLYTWLDEELFCDGKA